MWRRETGEASHPLGLLPQIRISCSFSCVTLGGGALLPAVIVVPEYPGRNMAAAGQMCGGGIYFEEATMGRYSTGGKGDDELFEGCKPMTPPAQARSPRDLGG